MPGLVHSGSASWDDCVRMFPDKLSVNSFPNKALCLDSSIVSPLRLRWVKGGCVFRCNLHFWQNDRGLLHATAITLGRNRHQQMSQHAKLTREKKILPWLLPGFEHTNFWSQIWRSYQQAITAPYIYFKAKKQVIWCISLEQSPDCWR